MGKEYFKEEPFKKATKQEVENIKKLLNKKREGDFSPPYILKIINTKDSLRRIFLSVLKKNPAKISEIVEDTLIHKQNCYPILSQLVTLNLLKRVFVVDVVDGKYNDSDEDGDEMAKKVVAKFRLWTEHMPENTMRYYLAKTSYWKVTDFGKQFVVKAYTFEQKFREKGDD